LSVIYVQVCDSVYAGEAIGLAGSTGNSTGAHLHFEIRQGGENIDPWFVIQ
jgi:murein DD-endopeptidase MepM/ murein hydrolase activator NlpD